MNDARFRYVPKILETPKGPEMKEDVRNMRVLRSLVTKEDAGRRLEVSK
jgi:deoxyribonuclease-4